MQIYILKKFFLENLSLQFIEDKKNLKEMLAPSSYLRSVNSQVNIITPCNSCDICKHYLVAERKFTSKVTGKTYFIKGDLSCNSKNVIYLITCDKHKDEYLGSAVDFKTRYRVHKSDIKTKKERCVTSRHFNEKCLCSTSPFGYAKVQINEQVYSENPSNIEEVLWYRERYWQSQFFTVTHGMNSINDL